MHACFVSLVLILIGLSLGLGALFNISIPILRLLFAGWLIYWGISLLITPSSKKQTPSHTAYHSQAADYVTVFGSQHVDLSQYDTSRNKKLEIIYVGSSGTITLNPALPTRITVKNVASKLHVPRYAFDRVAQHDDRPLTDVFCTQNYSAHDAALHIEVIAVFSSVEIAC